MERWTREQTLIALNLYCQLEFGKFHKSNPKIIEISKKIGKTPSALAMKLSNLASLDNTFLASGRKGLSRTTLLDKAIWSEFQKNPDLIGLESQVLMDNLALDNRNIADLSTPVSPDTDSDYSAENRSAQVKVRMKQNFFRKAVLSSYENKCCMSGIMSSQLLVASHIVPWAQDENNRLNPANGLCLSALHDKAFDKGLITVTPDLSIRISQFLKNSESSKMVQDYLLNLEGKKISAPRKIAPDKKFLEYHSTKIFLG